jgi:putrescine transport system ATP-binding protein
MALSTRLAVMDRGGVMQVGTPTEIYEFPNSRFTADFIGSVNMFDGIVKSDEGEFLVISSPELEEPLMAGYRGSLAVGTQVSVAMRPEKIAISRTKPEAGGRNAVRGTVFDLGYFGNHSLYRVRLASGKFVQVSFQNVRRASESERQVDWDDEVWLSWEPQAALVLTE